MSGSTIMWTTVEVFRHRGTAEVGGSALRRAGIPHRVVADDGSRGLTLRRTNGAELQVPADQAEGARTLLRVGVAAQHDEGDDDEAIDLPRLGGAMNWIAVLTILVLLAAVVVDIVR